MKTLKNHISTRFSVLLILAGLAMVLVHPVTHYQGDHHHNPSAVTDLDSGDSEDSDSHHSGEPSDCPECVLIQTFSGDLYSAAQPFSDFGIKTEITDLSHFFTRTVSGIQLRAPPLRYV